MGELASFLPLVAIALLFWLLVVRPASRRQKAVAKLQADLQPGERVMLSSGIFGTVRSLADDRARVEIAPGHRDRGRARRHQRRRDSPAEPADPAEPTDPTDPTAEPGDRSPLTWPRASPTRVARSSSSSSVVALSYGLVALAGVWKPKLGLDLQGGTRITLIAKGDVSSDSLAEARGIIDGPRQRLRCRRGRGLHPGQQVHRRRDPRREPPRPRRDRQAQAQLRFRLVALRSPTARPAPAAPCRHRHRHEPDTGAGVPGSSPTSSAPEGNTAGNNRAPYAWADENTAERQGQDEDADARRPRPTESPATEEPTPAATRSTTRWPGWTTRTPSRWLPSTSSAARPTARPPTVDDDPDKPLITCDEHGQKFLLSAALIEGTDLSSASTLPPSQQSVDWGVNLNFNGAGTKAFARISQALVNTEQAVRHRPRRPGDLGADDRRADHRRQRADHRRLHRGRGTSLATSLKYGALPIAFEKDPPVELVGPSLAGNQLSAGIIAGIVGLVLVMLYCLLYYRGLGIVVIASLLVAAALTYALVLLLSEGAGFTLTLPGIAGLIVAVGITADSFIVYFERIRDEMRDGKSMRVAVETGWVRARNTCLAADAVSLLAARGPLHLRDRRGEGLRVRARPVDPHRPRGVLLVHQADGVLAGPLQVLQPGPQAVRPRAPTRSASTAVPTAGGKA